MAYTKELLDEILQEGNATVLEEYNKFTQRLSVKFRCSCGEDTSKRFEMLKLYRLPYCKECSLKMKEEHKVKTCMERYGVKNSAMIDSVKEKIQTSFNTRFGGHPKRSKDVQEKWKQTCLEKYGGHPNQNPNVQAKQEINSYKFKEFTFPSGRLVKYQGYENLAINDLLKIYPEDDIYVGRGAVPIFHYECEGIKRVYFPDIFIKSSNTIIEVKSEWTVKLHTARLDDKAKGVKEAGYNFEVWVYSEKKVKVATQVY